MARTTSAYEDARDADLEASGLNDAKTITKLGGLKVLTPAETEAATGVEGAMSYEIVYHDLDGKPTNYRRWKLIGTTDRELKGGKYRQPEGTIPKVYFPPLRPWKQIAQDASKRILITEGEKKAACGCLLGLNVLGLGGVWNFKSKRWNYEQVPDLDLIVWEDRDVEVVFDNDLSENEHIRRAADTLCAALWARGARVFVRRLPPTENKTGLDEFLVAFDVKRYLELECEEWSATLISPPDDPLPNARRALKEEFAHVKHVERPLLVYQGGQFYAWNDTCWPALEEAALRRRVYKWADQKTYLSRTRVPAKVRFAPNPGKVSALVDTLTAETLVPTERPVPSWLDDRSSPPASEFIAFTNGLLHWPTQKLYPHSPLFYNRYSLPFAFDAKAPKPKRWLAFVKQLWGDDAESIRALQELFGYAISGDTRLHKMFLIVGPKRAGKGTIARALTGVLGAHNVAGPTLASLGGNFGLQPLIDKPVAIVADARLGGRTDSSVVTERLLSISGEDTLTVDRKHITSWTGKLPTRVILLSNELPRFTDSSGAIASRFVVLQLTESFFGREDTNLDTELKAELPGILNWSLDGLRSLRKRGRFVQPKSSEDAMRAMEDLGSPVLAFVREECVVDATQCVTPDELFSKWRTWCMRSGHQSGAKETFGRSLRAAMPAVRRAQRGTGKKKHPVLRGIGLKTPKALTRNAA